MWITTPVTFQVEKVKTGNGQSIGNMHLDIEPLTTTLWLRPSNQFLSHQTVHPSNLYFSNLERRMLSTDLVTPS